jgi:hypothetical protein
MRRALLLGLLLSAGCEAPSDLEEGPVILLCKGERVVSAANGRVEREARREFYRVDGAERTLATWDDNSQSFGLPDTGLTISATEASYTRNNPPLGGLTSAKSVTFDRVAGRVKDEFILSNGGVITFEAPCEPVKDPTSGQKF